MPAARAAGRGGRVRILLDCKNYRYGHRLTLTDSDAANNVFFFKYLYVHLLRPAGHESGLRTTCWFYAESTGVPHNNYLQNLNHMHSYWMCFPLHATWPIIDFEFHL